MIYYFKFNLKLCVKGGIFQFMENYKYEKEKIKG